MIDGNSASIIIALIAIIGAAFGTLGWVVRYFATQVVSALRAHTKAADRQVVSNNKLAKSVDKNTDSNDEVLTFMKNLNGKLAKATIQTVKEQNVEHQHIEKVNK